MITQNLFEQKIIGWYQSNKRDLPWRNTKDPYKIWLSEVILQQTRVAQGLPYYEKFVENYPDVISLADAPEQEVLRLWQGLGYYSRARNMHATAKLIANQYNGVFPNSYAELIKLKGIGPYTAAAIASFAFKEKVAVVDGNVYRVLARVFGIETDIASNEAKKVFGELANQLISEKHPDTFNQAIMEFGATHCIPANPQCMFCIFHYECEANATGRQATLPIKSKKVKVRERFFNYYVLEYDDKILMRQRDIKDIWGGLNDFYLVEDDQKLLDFDEVEDEVLSGILKQSTIANESEEFTHILTHQRIKAKFWHLKLDTQPKKIEGYEWYNINEIDKLPKPILIEKYLKKYHF
ncbi:MAG: A/G-specific adenine glycosylase [Spirosomataceae bacterium]